MVLVNNRITQVDHSTLALPVSNLDLGILIHTYSTMVAKVYAKSAGIGFVSQICPISWMVLVLHVFVSQTIHACFMA